MTQPFRDVFAPPQFAVKCRCVHCGDVYKSNEMIYEKRNGLTLWWCRNKDCQGAGFGFDVFEEP